MAKKLTDAHYAEINRVCAKAAALVKEGKFFDARETYWIAFDSLPEPRESWNISSKIIALIGDSFFLQKDFKHAIAAFSDAVRCKDGLGNVFIHLRKGQCHFELGDMKRAADDLTRAYLGGGREAFENEDPKYFHLLEQILKPPKGQSKL